MKTLFAVLSVLLVAVAVTMAAVPQEYSIQVPSGWKKNQGSAAKEHYMKDGVSFILTVDTAPASAKTPEQFMEYVKKQLAGTFKNTAFEPVKKVTVNGQEGRELVYTGEMSGIKMKYDVYYFPKGGSYYTLTFGGMAMMFDDVKADITTIVNSFKMK